MKQQPTETVYRVLHDAIREHCPRLASLYPTEPGNDSRLTRANILSMQVDLGMAMQLRRMFPQGRTI